MKRGAPPRPTNRLDNKPSDPNAQPVTLADLKAEQRLVWVYCIDCCREREVEPDTIPLPLETPVPSVGKRLKCSDCGGQLQAKPQLYAKTIFEMRGG